MFESNKETNIKTNTKENKDYTETKIKKDFYEKVKNFQNETQEILSREKINFYNELNTFLESRHIHTKAFIWIEHKKDKIKYNLSSYIKYSWTNNLEGKNKISYSIWLFVKNNNLESLPLNNTIDHYLNINRPGLYPNSYNSKYWLFINVKNRNNVFSITYERKGDNKKLSSEIIRKDPIFSSSIGSINLYSKLYLVNYLNWETSKWYLGKISYKHNLWNVKIELWKWYKLNFNNHNKDYQTTFGKVSIKNIKIEWEYKKDQKEWVYKIKSNINLEKFTNLTAIYEKYTTGNSKIEIWLGKNLNNHNELFMYVWKTKKDDSTSDR